MARFLRQPLSDARIVPASDSHRLTGTSYSQGTLSMSNGYSGKTKFQFQIERDDKLITLTVEGQSCFQPGRYFGPPEMCYPDEGETEITSVVGPNNEDWSDKISDEEAEIVLEMIQDKVVDELDDYHWG